MSYLVLARKYRPQSFEDLVGQEHVTQTLANAIAQDRVAHAFLFTGVRGVGKTTSARILAKCLNCLGADGQSKGPTATPCQTCAACTEIAAGTDMDVQEIDGASYNGVDEVRRLQEGLAFRPARDRHKLYIVDEVHMLSNAAWNAFLKTLEEPPPHVKFIFATTEVHKVPVTILSRCQRYDFKLVSAKTLAKHIDEVLAAEKIVAEESAVSVVAREAAGSVRDAMSLLDQVIAFSGDKVSGEDVARVLGVADRQVLHQLTSAILAGDAASALTTIDAVARQGMDLVHLSRDLLRHLRNLVVAKVCSDAQARELLDLADAEIADVLALAQKTDADDLSRLFQGLSKGYDEIVKSGQVRSALEMTIVRLARRPVLLPLDELLARLGELEKRLATGAPPPTRGGAGGGGGGRTTTTPPSATPYGGPPGVAGTGAGGGVAKVDNPFSVFEPPRAVLEKQAARMAAAEPPPPPASAPRLVAQGHEGGPHGATQTSGALALAPAPVVVVAPVDDDKTLTWRKILERVRAVRPAIASALELAAPVQVTREKIVLAFERDSFEDARAEEMDARALVEEHGRAHFGAPTEVVFEVAARGSKIASIAFIDAAKRKAAVLEARAAVERHELVRKVITLLDAELREIRLPQMDD